MADPNIAIAITIDSNHEGGFQNDPEDHANWSSGKIGEGTLVGTKYGITALDMPGVNIADITVTQAETYYDEHYWKSLYSEIEDQFVANKLFDMGVLFGVGTAVMLMQGILKLTPDQVFGPFTLAAVNEADPHSLLTAYKMVLVQHALDTGANNPAERGDVLGWIRRINS